jgi:hypothetical protein
MKRNVAKGKAAGGYRRRGAAAKLASLACVRLWFFPVGGVAGFRIETG